MPRNQYNYNVFDLTVNSFILKNVEASTVAHVTGIDKIKVCVYASQSYIYDKRYSITRTPIHPDPIDEPIYEDAETKMPDDFKDEWNKIRFIINPNAKMEVTNGLS